MRIGFLGAGTWGFCLASLLASKGFETISWTRDPELAQRLNMRHEHPFLPGYHAKGKMSFTTEMQEAISSVDFIVESVTSAGLRPVFEQVKQLDRSNCPIILTSKGIEQHTCITLPQVLLEVLGESARNQIASLSGPSYAAEVIRHLPTSVVATAYESSVIHQVCDLFNTSFFRVYPNHDILGVSYGGALKNVTAIACGITEGLGLGYSAKAAVMTRGLHEIRKLAVAKGCRAETLNGLSGMGDLWMTCSALLSRNCRFGYLLAQGFSPQEAHRQIGRVVEGAYTCISALELSQKLHIPMPITDLVHKIIYQGLPISLALQSLMERPIKEETL